MKPNAKKAVCTRGHEFTKSPVLPVCPKCWPGHYKAGNKTTALVKLKRVYEPFDAKDGCRVLVDRLWPRGLSKEKARVDLWLKDIGPSTALRKWFAHDPSKWDGFCRKYEAELLLKTGLVEQVKALGRKGRMTLLYSARDESHNNAVVLLGLLEKE